jgi:hypothetical protein
MAREARPAQEFEPVTLPGACHEMAHFVIAFKPRAIDPDMSGAVGKGTEGNGRCFHAGVRRRDKGAIRGVPGVAVGQNSSKLALKIAYLAILTDDNSINEIEKAQRNRGVKWVGNLIISPLGTCAGREKEERDNLYRKIVNF